MRTQTTFLTLIFGLFCLGQAQAAGPLYSCAQSVTWTQPLATTRHVDPKPLDDTARQALFAGELGYFCSGDYMRDVTAKVDEARAALAQRSPGAGEKLAIVLDIDETSLTNEPQLLGGSLHYPSSGANDPCDVANLQNGCGYTTFELMAAADAMRPTLELFREAVARHIAVFLITGRYDDPAAGALPAMRDATKKNLAAAGYGAYTCLFLQPRQPHSGPADWSECHDISANMAAPYASTGAFKSAVRQAIHDAGYTIAVNMGDQPSDLGVKSINDDGLSEKWFLLPNPFY